MLEFISLPTFDWKLQQLPSRYILPQIRLPSNRELLNLYLKPLSLDFLLDAMAEPLNSIQHTTIADYSSLLDAYSLSLLFLLLPVLADCYMLSELEAAGAAPARGKIFAWAGRAGLFIGLVKLVGMLAAALEVLGAVDGNIKVVGALASCELALDLILAALEVVVGFVRVVAEALGRGADGLAAHLLGIIPGVVEPMLCLLRISLFVFCELLLRHHHAAVVPHQVTVLLVSVNVLRHQVRFQLGRFRLHA